MRERWKLWRLAAMCVLATLPSCGLTMASAGIECEVFPPIRWSIDDTDETIRQVKAHNAAWRAWGCPR